MQLGFMYLLSPFGLLFGGEFLGYLMAGYGGVYFIGYLMWVSDDESVIGKNIMRQGLFIMLTITFLITAFIVLILYLILCQLALICYIDFRIYKYVLIPAMIWMMILVFNRGIFK